MNLKTKYLGMELKTPLVVSASPLSEDLHRIRQMEDSGASAVVLYSLFEEQLVFDEHEFHHHTTAGTESFAEALSYFPEPDEFKQGPEVYLEHITKAKSAVSIPIIASLNGYSAGGWEHYASLIEQAGADALELNIYNIPVEIDVTAEEVEQNYLDILKAVKENINIPVALKLSPYFSNMANMAKKVVDAGADALVLFNRFYQPDIDLNVLEVKPNIVLSKPTNLRLPMRWLAILYGQVKADLAATSGIHTGLDVIKMMMVGANVAMLNSVLLKKGISRISRIEMEIREWMDDNEYESIEQMRGSMSHKNVANPGAYERALYMKALTGYQI